MHALLQSDDVVIPADLDNSILAAAHEAVNQDSQQNEPSTSWRPNWYQGFATAAVIVLGIVLVPLIIPSQEASNDLADAEFAAASDQPVTQLRSPAPESATASSRALVQGESEGVAETARSAIVLRESEPEPLQDSATGAQLSKQRAELASGENEHRATPEAWVEEILRLHKEKDLEKSREEFSLFALRYPDHELMKRIPEEIR